MFEITTSPIDRNQAILKLGNPRVGGLATFEGWVRNHHEGQDVLRLEYEAYAALCINEAQILKAEVMEDYDIIRRIWHLEIPFRVIPRAVTVSARKYRKNNYFRVQIANLLVFRMYRQGATEEAMISRYRAMLRD